MWKCYVKNNYLYLTTGTIEYRRLKCKVQVTKENDDYFFKDRVTTFLVIPISQLTDENGVAFTAITFDDFITLNTGE